MAGLSKKLAGLRDRAFDGDQTAVEGLERRLQRFTDKGLEAKAKQVEGILREVRERVRQAQDQAAMEDALKQSTPAAGQEEVQEKYFTGFKPEEGTYYYQGVEVATIECVSKMESQLVQDRWGYGRYEDVEVKTYNVVPVGDAVDFSFARKWGHSSVESAVQAIERALPKGFFMPAPEMGDESSWSKGDVVGELVSFEGDRYEVVVRNIVEKGDEGRVVSFLVGEDAITGPLSRVVKMFEQRGQI